MHARMFGSAVLARGVLLLSILTSAASAGHYTFNDTKYSSGAPVNFRLRIFDQPPQPGVNPVYQQAYTFVSYDPLTQQYTYNVTGTHTPPSGVQYPAVYPICEYEVSNNPGTWQFLGYVNVTWVP